MNSEHEVFKKIILKLKTTNENLNTTLSALEREQTTLKEDVKRLDALTMYLENENTNLKGEHANLKADVNRLKAKLIEQDNENNILKTQFDLLIAGDNIHDALIKNGPTSKNKMAQEHGFESRDVILTDGREYKFLFNLWKFFNFLIIKKPCIFKWSVTSSS